MRKILLKLFIFLFLAPAFVRGEVTLRLGTATKSGSYYKLGESMKSVCAGEINIQVVESEGSVDNIYKLEKGEIDIALVQNDIAFFAENAISPFDDKFKELAGIMTFYPEPIFIATNVADIHYLDQLRSLGVNVGPLKSGLRADAKIVLNSLDLWENVGKTDFEPSDALTYLNNHNISAAFMNNLSAKAKILVREGKIFIIPFPQSLIRTLTHTYPYFKVYQTKLSEDSIATIAVKSILICKKDASKDIIYSLTKQLSVNYNDLAFPGNYTQKMFPHRFESMPLRSWHKGALKYYIDSGAMKSKIFSNLLLILLVFGSLAIIAIFIFDFFVFVLSRKSLRMLSANSRILGFLKSMNILIVNYKYLAVILLMLTAYLLDIYIIQYFEHFWALAKGDVSSFDYHTFIENLQWVITFSASGYADEYFPRSQYGKFFASLIPVIGIGSFLTVVGMLTGDHIKKKIQEAKGERTKMIKNHIIICGWNENVPHLVKNLIHKNIIVKRPIIILANVEEENPLSIYKIENELVSFVRGDATSRQDLDKANIKDADIAIIVADAGSSDPDARNILKVLNVEAYCHKLEVNKKRDSNKRDNIYTIVELQGIEQYESAYNAHVDEILSFGLIKSKMFVQSVLNPGVSTFLNQILTFDDHNDLYSFHVKEKGPLCGKTFDELLLKLRKENILLLSINIGYQHEKEVLEKTLEENSLTSQIITNPFLEEERKYKTKSGDVLIVLAQYEKDLKKALKRIEKSV